MVDNKSLAVQGAVDIGGVNNTYDISDFGILLNATICCESDGASAKKIIEYFQTDWGVDVDGIAKRIGYPGLEQFLQHEQIQKYVEAFPINDGDSIVYRAKSLSQNKHILIGIKENKLREEERDHNKSMQKYAELGKPENREAFIEGKRRILTILMELNAHLESVSFQAVQNEYLKRYKVFLNSSEQLRLFQNKSAIKNFKRAFFEEVSVEAENPLSVRLIDGNIKLSKEMTEEDRARVAKMGSRKTDKKETIRTLPSNHKKLPRVDGAGVYTDFEEEHVGVKFKSKSVLMNSIETNLWDQTIMNSLVDDNVNMETRNKAKLLTKPKLSKADEAGVYTDSDEDNFNEESENQNAQVDSMERSLKIAHDGTPKIDSTPSKSNVAVLVFDRDRKFPKLNGEKKLSRADEAGVYTDSDEDSLNSGLENRGVEMDLMKELPETDQEHIIKNSDTNSNSIGDVSTISTDRPSGEQRKGTDSAAVKMQDTYRHMYKNTTKCDPELVQMESISHLHQSRTFPQKKHSEDYVLSSSEESDLQSNGRNKTVRDHIHHDVSAFSFPRSSCDQVPASHKNSFPTADRHTRSTQTDPEWWDNVFSRNELALMTHNFDEGIFKCNNFKRHMQGTVTAQLTKVQKLANTIEVVMDRRSPQPLLLSHIPNLIGSIYGCAIDPLRDAECKISWNNLISLHCPSLQIYRLPNGQELVLEVETQ